MMARHLAAMAYRHAARASAAILASHPMVESVLLHRSAATGEVTFGRSDIDLLLVVDDRQAEDGGNLASLLGTLRRARLLNPALGHVDVYDAASLASHGRMDTFWSSVERRTAVLLRGAPVEPFLAPVHPDHALGKFLLWVEWFFAIAIRERNRRNLRKIALEAWNAYASAEGVTREPFLTRAEMEEAATTAEPDLAAPRLEEPGYAAGFVLALADRLHRSRLPALPRLRRPLIHDVMIPPLCLERRLVILPGPDSPLPPQAFEPDSFVCTPEVVDLFLHFKNAFVHWILGPELRDLGLRPPTIAGFLRSCLFYGHSRFLFTPGFAGTDASTQAARLAQIRHAVDRAANGELPPSFPGHGIQRLIAGAPSVQDYYRHQYGPLRHETRRLAEAVLALSTPAPGA
jgi:predicted nucleotidyltransferase